MSRVWPGVGRCSIPPEPSRWPNLNAHGRPALLVCASAGQAGRHLGGPPERLSKYLDRVVLRPRSRASRRPWMRPRHDVSPLPSREQSRFVLEMDGCGRWEAYRLVSEQLNAARVFFGHSPLTGGLRRRHTSPLRPHMLVESAIGRSLRPVGRFRRGEIRCHHATRRRHVADDSTVVAALPQHPLILPRARPAELQPGSHDRT